MLLSEHLGGEERVFVSNFFPSKNCYYFSYIQSSWTFVIVAKKNTTHKKINQLRKSGIRDASFFPGCIFTDTHILNAGNACLVGQQGCDKMQVIINCIVSNHISLSLSLSLHDFFY